MDYGGESKNSRFKLENRRGKTGCVDRQNSHYSNDLLADFSDSLFPIKVNFCVDQYVAGNSKSWIPCP